MKVIYAKRVKRILENEYNIFPVRAIPNPKDARYKAWEYIPTKELSLALAEIMASKGDNGNGNKNTY